MIYCHCCHNPFEDVESAEFVPTMEIGVYAVICKMCLGEYAQCVLKKNMQDMFKKRDV